MTVSARILLRHLAFTGPDVVECRLDFDAGLNLLFGASNTGKSFTGKVLDFMLGSSRPLPEIPEREGYDRAWLGMTMPSDDNVTLTRALVGAAFELHSGLVSSSIAGRNVRSLSARHDHTNEDNISQFLLKEIGLADKQIAIDANGKKRSLSFRDLTKHCIVDETTIQSEGSPVESGQYTTATAERSVFKLLLTGVDDSAVVPIVDKRVFKTQTSAKLEVFDEIITGLDERIAADYPDADDLGQQSEKLEETFKRSQQEFVIAQTSIREGLARKRELVALITQAQTRRGEIELNLARFQQLNQVYASDIARLEAVEEAGFLLMLGSDKDCPLCGAPPEAQRHDHGLSGIDEARQAALVEIDKIAKQKSALTETVTDLRAERTIVDATLEKLSADLTTTERGLEQLTPSATLSRQRVDELSAIRDRVNKGLSLLAQRLSLQTRREELAALKPASKADKPRLGVSSTTAHAFAQTVSKVLEEWQFPGKRHVSFDEVTYDLKIDGKQRRDNGKGVRAITHAAFKVALLMFCRERGLPHPGFLVLDTPLLTYRDPIRSKAGPLSADEQELRNTSVRDFFFEHLASLKDSAEFIIIENIDPPPGIEKLARTEVFTGDPQSGRPGLFPMSATQP